MIAFEISVNGQHFRTVAAGEYGLLSGDVMWSRVKQVKGTIIEDLRLMARGLEGNDGDSVHWPDSSLKLGDEVRIRIVEVDSLPEPPTGRITRDELRERAKAGNSAAST